MKKYQPKKGELFSYAKKFDGSFLPPCAAVLREKIKRVNHVTAKWVYSTASVIPDLPPEDSGWITDQANMYRLKWFEGDMTPKALDVIIEDTTIDEDVETLETDEPDDIIQRTYDSDDSDDDTDNESDID